MTEKQFKTHCNCNNNKSAIPGTCTNCSRVKIAVFTKNGNNNLVWLSHYAKNRKNFGLTVAKMWSKIQQNSAFKQLQGNINKVIAYDRFTNDKIELQW